MPRRRTDRLGQIGDYWLSRRPNSPLWCRTWFDATTRQTCRASLGTSDFEAARLALAQWVTVNSRRSNQDPRDVALAEVFARYYQRKGRLAVSAGVQRRNLYLALEMLPAGLLVSELTLDAQDSLARRLRAAQTPGGGEYQDGTVKRVLGTVKAAVNWAWKNGELERPVPFLSVPDGEPRERVLTIEEFARLWDAAEQPHLRMFILILLGTACRPKAALDLMRDQCDTTSRVITLNPPGRAQTKKRRPVVPLPDFLLPWVIGTPSGPLVAYRGRRVEKIAKAWRAAREAAGLDADVIPYAIRHTVATELRRRGVPEMELAGLLGHSMPNFRTTGRYAKYAPDYLSKAREAIDQIANEIGRVAARPISPETSVRASCVLLPKPRVTNPLKFGAGEGIRTLDPNLGKVVRWPLQATPGYPRLL